MRKTNVKIIGILLCVVVLGTLIPASAAQKPENPSSEPSVMLPRAMIIGRISEVHKIGRIVIAHAVRVHYLGMSLNMKLDTGMIRDHEIMFKQSPRFHMMTLGMNTIVLGNVMRLRFM
jgi:hypothetical protein